MITIVVLAGEANRSLINFALYCVLFSESILYKLNVNVYGKQLSPCLLGVQNFTVSYIIGQITYSLE